MESEASIYDTETFRCFQCSNEWSERPGPCSLCRCGSHRIEWLNFKRDWEHIGNWVKVRGDLRGHRRSKNGSNRIKSNG